MNVGVCSLSQALLSVLLGVCPVVLTGHSPRLTPCPDSVHTKATLLTAKTFSGCPEISGSPHVLCLRCVDTLDPIDVSAPSAPCPHLTGSQDMFLLGGHPCTCWPVPGALPPLTPSGVPMTQPCVYFSEFMEMLRCQCHHILMSLRTQTHSGPMALT